MKTLYASMLKLAAATALAVTAGTAAAGDVSWSVTVGSPYGGGYVHAPPPPVVYVEPRPVYVQPRPVYVQPRPVYVQPAPVVRYSPPYHYVEAPGPRHHWKHDRHHRHFHDRPRGRGHHGPHGR